MPAPECGLEESPASHRRESSARPPQQPLHKREVSQSSKYCSLRLVILPVSILSRDSTTAVVPCAQQLPHLRNMESVRKKMRERDLERERERERKKERIPTMRFHVHKANALRNGHRNTHTHTHTHTHNKRTFPWFFTGVVAPSAT